MQRTRKEGGLEWSSIAAFKWGKPRTDVKLSMKDNLDLKEPRNVKLSMKDNLDLKEPRNSIKEN
jgi:hypothetical protein